MYVVQISSLLLAPFDPAVPPFPPFLLDKEREKKCLKVRIYLGPHKKFTK